MEIKKMTLADLNSISSNLETDYDNFWNINILKKELQDSNSSYFIFKDKDEIIGFDGITIILDIAELNNIVIKKSFRWNGFSSLLLEELINYSNKNKCSKINLEVSKNNTIALNLYKKFGFTEVGVRKKYYNGIDAILLTKEFK